jgi:proteasome assembly chaperone (PAC2) family protein
MEYVTWTARPTLRKPVLVSAFAGWNDAAEAATTAISFLRQAWTAHPFASIDPEEFFDFSSVRPTVALRDGVEREISWPVTDLSVAVLPGSKHDVVLLQGVEPQLRWRTFCRQVTEIASSLGVEMVVTLGALLADVAHSRPVSIIGTATDSSLIARFGLQRSRYQGPTGIVGVLHDACTKAGLPTASLWAATPSYVAHARSPKAALALVERFCSLVGVSVSTTALEIAAAGYEREVNDLVAADDDTASYVERLEAMTDDGGPSFDEDDEDDDDEVAPVAVDDESGGVLVEEVERFLREQGS